MIMVLRFNHGVMGIHAKRTMKHDSRSEGVYSLVAWHPGVGGILHMQVVVLPNDILKTHFIFDAPPETRNAHTTMVDNPHFSIDAIGREGETPDVVTDHEVQGPMAHH